MRTGKEIPIWWDDLSPLGSAVRYVASLSPLFQWVGIYVLKKNRLVLGPYMGEPTEHTSIEVGQGVCGTAVALGKDQNVPDVRERDNYIACSLKTRSELVILIRDPQKRIVGQIDIDSDVPAAFTPDLEGQVKDIARQLGDLWPE